MISSSLPLLEDESGPLAAALTERGGLPEVHAWNATGVPWSDYDLVVLTSTWGHNDHREEFLQWCTTVPRLTNPANVIRWNSDKHYLQPLSEHGLPTIETTWLEPDRNYNKRDLHNRFPAQEEFVIKPAVAISAHGSGRYTATDADSRRYAINHAHRLLGEGHSVMVQRYIPEIDSHGEISLTFFHGTYSHAVRKEPMLSPGSEVVNTSSMAAEVSAHRASNVEIEAAQTALAFARARIPGRSVTSRPLLYAQVDLVRPSDGPPLIMELELTASFVHESCSPGALARFADAIMAEARMGPDSQNIDLA
ncbi:MULTISPECIES: RimK family alpha-L-glutamate ligase [unclassified Pseudactinotalea]|uniref:ATP-grasp domain-containing protein n=1 Tax=unclassified Pseudactinotalea TaxID=2649176 RepID=UPI00128DE1C1|nr:MULTISPECIES: hypothetical protein [unclassified Pseudactinotalea]MPV50234.1 hypothetical protein [Pseudactinotalea sp. HY160]QGH70174.1 hypothetical protein GCE65_12155 [Pseudactinotalea sp. HY158]